MTENYYCVMFPTLEVQYSSPIILLYEQTASYSGNEWEVSVVSFFSKKLFIILRGRKPTLRLNRLSSLNIVQSMLFTQC